MNELSIRQKIYEIRGQRVMLDFDLADAYGVETSQLKRQVRRNMERFEGGRLYVCGYTGRTFKMPNWHLGHKKRKNHKISPICFYRVKRGYA